jgi:phosphomannomutase
MAQAGGQIIPTRDPADKRAPILLLFDVDGTLTKSRLTVEKFMWDTLIEAKSKVYLGIVGGSDLPKQQEQLSGPNKGNIVDFFDFVFSENGLVAYHKGKPINDHNLLKELGEEDIQSFVNFCLRYIADLKLPKKRGTFVEFRTGMINVCPIGRNCSQEERLEFYALDQKENIRAKMIEVFEKQMPDLAKKLKSSIGGQISYDVFPHGWDKTYCLQFLPKMDFKEIHFFGDKAYPGGNDYEIYEDKRTIGHKVTQPQDTVKLIREILDKLDKK